MQPVWLIGLSLPLLAGALIAQESESPRYSPEVVAKAEKALNEIGLRRSGKSIQSVGIPAVSRAISGLAREKRELRLVHQDWKKVADQLVSLGQEQQRLNAQYGELNLQLARVAGVDVAANNRIVGLLNATSAKTKEAAAQREQVKEQLQASRKLLDDAEARYAETVIAIRRDYDAARDQLDQTLQQDKMRIALGVMHANFATPQTLTADQILSSLDKRIERIEQEIFSESIGLDADQGSLMVDVVVGSKSTRMVVDSGATLVTLPIKTATELGIVVPVDARSMSLVLADGSSIPARGVTLSRVRVGQFEAENVEAAVLDAVATNAQPLLGMSFLSNFKFEIDSSGKTLKMLRVATE
jgi:aspartyl protease family protein